MAGGVISGGDFTCVIGSGVRDTPHGTKGRQDELSVLSLINVAGEFV